MKRNSLVMFLALFVWSGICPAQEQLPPFKDGDRVVFFGDSITHGGLYLYCLQTFYATRLPESKIEFINAGISGSELAGSLSRVETDVLECKPTRVYAMFGMNDVNRGLYRTLTPDKQNQDNRQYAVEVFLKSNQDLADRLNKAGIPLTLVSPSPYDQYAKTGAVDICPACNDGLSNLTSVLGEFAKAKQIPFLDLHTPMTRMLQEHPEMKYSSDRIHPGMAGSLIMACEIVKAQGLSPIVAKAEIDAAASTAILQVNCSVTEVKKAAEGVSFLYFPRAIPYPVTADYKQAAPVCGLDAMNQELLQINGLAEGRYTVKIADKLAGTFDQQTLAKGVNMALLDTPQQANALAIWRAVEKKKQTCDEPLRCYWMVRFGMQKKGIDPQDRAACDKYIAAVNSSNDAYGKAVVAIFAKHRDALAELLQQQQAAQKTIFALQRTRLQAYPVSVVKQ